MLNPYLSIICLLTTILMPRVLLADVDKSNSAQSNVLENEIDKTVSVFLGPNPPKWRSEIMTNMFLTPLHLMSNKDFPLWARERFANEAIIILSDSSGLRTADRNFVESDQKVFLGHVNKSIVLIQNKKLTEEQIDKRINEYDLFSQKMASIIINKLEMEATKQSTIRIRYDALPLELRKLINRLTIQFAPSLSPIDPYKNVQADYGRIMIASYIAGIIIDSYSQIYRMNRTTEGTIAYAGEATDFWNKNIGEEPKAGQYLSNFLDKYFQELGPGFEGSFTKGLVNTFNIRLAGENPKELQQSQTESKNPQQTPQEWISIPCDLVLTIITKDKALGNIGIAKSKLLTPSTQGYLLPPAQR